MSKVLVTTIPFAVRDPKPLEILKKGPIELVMNPIGRKLKEDELAGMIGEYDALVAGTEPITKKVLENASQLKLISRVGIGLDSVDLHEARKRGIKVAYTPDGPTAAVSDLTIGLMLSLLRQVHVSNLQLRRDKWHRFFGRRLGEVKIGLIGAGRIGKQVLERLRGFEPKTILVNDLEQKPELSANFDIQWASKEEIYKEADLISLHIPLTPKTRDLIRKRELQMMKPDALLVNTSRGGIIHEADLLEVLKEEHLGGVALDVFDEEPYSGPLKEIDRCLLTAHMGSMSVDCRSRMELEAAEEVIRLFSNEPLKNEVPELEYQNQSGDF